MSSALHSSKLRCATRTNRSGNAKNPSPIHPPSLVRHRSASSLLRQPRENLPFPHSCTLTCSNTSRHLQVGTSPPSVRPRSNRSGVSPSTSHLRGARCSSSAAQACLKDTYRVRDAPLDSLKDT